MDRLKQIRELLKRLDGTQPIQVPSEHGYYVEPPDSTAEALAKTLEIDPTSSHLVLGSVGCGKSTALLAAGRRLLGTKGIYVRYFDVSQFLDLEEADEVALALAAADELVDHLSDSISSDRDLGSVKKRLHPLTKAHELEYTPDDEGPDVPWVIPLPRPRPDVPGRLARHLDVFSDLVKIVYDNFQGASLVWLIDGLDRLADPMRFDALMEPFLRLLKSVGVGFACTGPRRVLTGVDRLGAASAFGEVHLIRPVDTDDGTSGATFLNSVLDARDVAPIVPPEQRQQIVQWSGGVLRILFQLTRRAVTEAWKSNAEVVGPEHVSAAADHVGRGLWLGVSDFEAALLRSVLDTGNFAPRKAEHVALVLTNRVLEHGVATGTQRYSVHPTIRGFVSMIRVKDEFAGAFNPF